MSSPTSPLPDGRQGGAPRPLGHGVDGRCRPAARYAAILVAVALTVTTTLLSATADPSAASQPRAKDTQAPTVPGTPTVLEVVPGAVTITWAASTDNRRVTEYYVYQADQFYEVDARHVVRDNSPLTLSISPTAAHSYFWVAARDKAGNISARSGSPIVPQPPSFPRSGDNTVPPTRPGDATVTGTTPEGRLIVTWTPATDDEGVLEYHVYQTYNLDIVTLAAKVSTNSAVIVPHVPFDEVRIVAYDASWNSSSTGGVRVYPPAALPAG